MTDRIEELMDANLRRVFGERDPERRRVAIEETYTRSSPAPRSTPPPRSSPALPSSTPSVVS